MAKIKRWTSVYYSGSNNDRYIRDMIGHFDNYRKGYTLSRKFKLQNYKSYIFNVYKYKDIYDILDNLYFIFIKDKDKTIGVVGFYVFSKKLIQIESAFLYKEHCRRGIYGKIINYLRKEHDVYSGTMQTHKSEYFWRKKKAKQTIFREENVFLLKKI